MEPAALPAGLPDVKVAVQGVIAEFETESGKAVSIKRI
jgi:hypothetical protein